MYDITQFKKDLKELQNNRYCSMTFTKFEWRGLRKLPKVGIEFNFVPRVPGKDTGGDPMSKGTIVHKTYSKEEIVRLKECDPNLRRLDFAMNVKELLNNHRSIFAQSKSLVERNQVDFIARPNSDTLHTSSNAIFDYPTWLQLQNTNFEQIQSTAAIFQDSFTQLLPGMIYNFNEVTTVLSNYGLM